MLVAHALLALNQEIHSEKSGQFTIIKKMAARSILESIVPLILKTGQDTHSKVCKSKGSSLSN